jgi:sugar/nucleoside kinase (ribokinase family)
VTTSPPIHVVSIGAIHHDTLAHATIPIHPETSTPAKLNSRPGGVATNIARALARLNVPTHLIGTVGTDAAADALREQLLQEGVKLGLVPRKGFATGQYLALHNPDGALTAACVDDRVLSEAPTNLFDDVLKNLLAGLPQDGIWFLDANLSEAMLLRLTERISGTTAAGYLIANAVSDAKATRLSPVLSLLDCLLLNRGEAAAITGSSIETPTDDLTMGLANRGLQRFVLTDGASDVLLYEEGEVYKFAPPVADIVDVTGAGDALTAGTIAALARGYSYKEAVPYGLSAAALILRSTGALSKDLSWEALQQP